MSPMPTATQTPSNQVAGFEQMMPAASGTFGDVLPTEAIRLMASLMVDNDPAVSMPAQTLPTAELVAGLPPEDLTRISCPVHLVAGDWELGGSLPERDLQRWAQLVPQATSRVIPNVGHSIRFAPHALPTYLRDLDQFLNQM